MGVRGSSPHAVFERQFPHRSRTVMVTQQFRATSRLTEFPFPSMLLVALGRHLVGLGLGPTPLLPRHFSEGHLGLLLHPQQRLQADCPLLHLISCLQQPLSWQIEDQVLPCTSLEIALRRSSGISLLQASKRSLSEG